MRNERPSRRRFCLVTGAGLGAGMLLVGLPGCDPGTGERIGEGSLDNQSGGTGGNGGGGGTAGGGGGGGGGNAGGGGGGGGGSAGGGGGGGGSHDMAGEPADMSEAACTAGSVSAGTASSYTVGGTPKYFSGSTELFVLRDSGGLMAVSAICTHSGCTLEVQSSEYYCNCHGATFAFDGSMPTSPAHSALKHYAMCVDASGNVTVDPKTTVSSTNRY